MTTKERLEELVREWDAIENEYLKRTYDARESVDQTEPTRYRTRALSYNACKRDLLNILKDLQ